MVAETGIEVVVVATTAERAVLEAPTAATVVEIAAVRAFLFEMTLVELVVVVVVVVVFLVADDVVLVVVVVVVGCRDILCCARIACLRFFKLNW